MKLRAIFAFCLFAILCLAGTSGISRAQILNLPPRATNAPTGTQFENIMLEMSQQSRENWVLYQILQGNVPSWMRNLVPVTINKTINSVAHSLTYYVIPDYLSIGSDTNYFQEPMSPILAQRLANLLNCTLPTRLMVNQIWTNSTVRMTSNTFNPSNFAIDTPPVFILENTANMAERFTTTNAHPLGALVSGDKKDIIESTLIYTNFFNGPSITNVVVIYGWIQPDGSPIQPEFNGHEETYMDYSHGTRLVQMAVTLDGAPNTVTNILTDPVLNPLLSDEGVIAKPFYTIDNFKSPYIITQPVNQNIKLGGTANLNVVATGITPFTYVWKINGATVAGATSSALIITNAQAANAGTYVVTISNGNTPASSIPAVLRVSTNAFPLLFNDSLGTDTSTNWNFFFATSDYTTNWAYDFSLIPYNWNGATYLIPPAPSTPDGSTRALKFTVNDTTGLINGVNVYPKGKFFSNNFALKFDMWINYPGGAGGSGSTGSTEFAICGINHLGTESDWDATSPPSTDGMWFAVDGEGGSTNGDYRAFLGNPAGAQTAATGLVATLHTNAPFPTLFSANRFETAGAPGKTWVGGEIDQSNGVVTWKMDGTIVAQRSNTSIYTNGNIMIGYMDIFASIASPLADAFILYDNVRVEDWSAAPLQAPAATLSPLNPTVLSGTNITFNAATTGASPFTYQWFFNGTNIPGATASSYLLTAAQTTNSGTYNVTVSNAAGSIISSGTTLNVNVRPFSFSGATMLANGNLQLSFNGAIGSHYTIQTSSNLVTWLPLATVTNLANPVTFVDTNTTGVSQRFYRMVTAP